MKMGVIGVSVRKTKALTVKTDTDLVKVVRI